MEIAALDERWRGRRSRPAFPWCGLLHSAPGAQQLRLGGVVAGSAAALLVPAPFEQLQIGWGYAAGQPRPGFGGQVYAVIAGGGNPSEAELRVLKRFLAARAGLAG